jgi:hypothetical protein
LFTFVVSASEAGTTMTANGVDFVNENNGRALRLGLLEEVTNP